MFYITHGKLFRQFYCLQCGIVRNTFLLLIIKNHKKLFTCKELNLSSLLFGVEAHLQ